MDAFETVPVDDTMDQTPAGAAAIERFRDATSRAPSQLGFRSFSSRGEADQAVPLVATTLLRDRLCDAGEVVHLDVVPDTDHDEVLDPLLVDVVSWINARFGGQTVTGCD